VTSRQHAIGYTPVDSGTEASDNPARLDGAMESPSLAVAGDPDRPAYEVKFLLTERQAQEVEDCVRGRLVPDAHAETSLGNAYLTTSLYCDTAQFDVFHRLGSFKRRKHRVRRYGHAPCVFLERKIKWGERVKKMRTMVPDAQLAWLANPMSATTWAGHWFHRHLVRRQLLPVCRIAYERVALVGNSEEGPMRLTFDRRIRGVLTSEWRLDDVDNGMPLLTDHVICEFKYRSFLPSLFKEIILGMKMTPSPVSKYRSFLRTSSRDVSAANAPVGTPEDRRAADA
jgi:hypothetical protein